MFGWRKRHPGQNPAEGIRFETGRTSAAKAAAPQQAVTSSKVPENNAVSEAKPKSRAQPTEASSPTKAPFAFLFRTVRVEDPNLVRDLENAGVKFTGVRPSFMSEVLWAWVAASLCWNLVPPDVISASLSQDASAIDPAGLQGAPACSSIAGKLADSTVKGYKDSWRCHIKKRITGRVRDFSTVDGENLMTEIEAANKADDHDLAHGTYRHIKVALSAMFTFAKRKGVYEGGNPMTGVTIPKGKKHGRRRLAYSPDEVEAHLEAFADDPLVKAIIGTGAFAGLREGEIRGLWVEDDEGHLLNIRRSVWRTIVKDTKTEEDEDDPGVMPIIRPLRLLLDQVKPAYGWLFPNTIGGPLDLHNLANRVIKPRFKQKLLPWKGWHAYHRHQAPCPGPCFPAHMRGLATNLHALGVDDKTIQAIVRHEDVSTTQRSYIKTPPQIVTNAMAKLDAQIRPCVTLGRQTGASSVVNLRKQRQSRRSSVGRAADS
jgi:integrase